MEKKVGNPSYDTQHCAYVKGQSLFWNTLSKWAYLPLSRDTSG
jgi:hypothetical protein